MGFDDFLKEYGGKAGDAVSSFVSNMLNAQMGKISSQVKVKVALEKGLPPADVTDLDITEYMLAMPTAATNKALADKMEYIGKSTRNGLIIGLGLVAVAIVVTHLVKNERRDS